jgi:hypothetical protein
MMAITTGSSINVKALSARTFFRLEFMAMVNWTLFSPQRHAEFGI